MSAYQQVKTISIVIPVYNEADVLDELYRRVEAVVDRLGLPYELILVDDGSRDQSWAKLLSLQSKNHNVRLLRLSRNFGHQAALTAGLDHCNGDAVLILDADLQDPPELLGDMLARLDENCQVVYGVRRTRTGEGRLKRFTAACFYRFINAISEVPMPLDAGDFRLLSRLAVDKLRELRQVHRFIRGMVSWIGFRQCPIYYDRAARFGGASKYTLLNMVRLAGDGIISFSSFPLKVLWALCIAELVAGAAVAVAWPIPALLLVLAGLQLLGLAILTSYIVRTYHQGQGRPIYIVAELIE